MRKWHRQIMTVFIFTLTYWVISGLIMALYDATDRTQVWAIEGGGPGARVTDFAMNAQAIPAPNALQAGIDAARVAVGGMAIASVDLRQVGTATRLQFADASGARTRMRRFYADTTAPMSDRVADGDSGAPPPPNVTLRNTIKKWHRGNILGIPGQLVGLTTGLALIGLAVTGVLTYLQLWQPRRRAHKGALFWSGRESLWRRLHRWVAIVAAVFVLNIAVSGVILAVGEIQLNLFLVHHIGTPPYPRPTPMPAVSSGPLTGDLRAMLDTSYRAAQAAAPGAAIAALTLINRDGLVKGLVTLAGANPRVLAFDATSGAPVADWATTGTQAGNGYYADWHQVLKRFHRGDIIGHFAGRYFDLLAGLALLYLVISAGVLYFEPRR